MSRHALAFGAAFSLVVGLGTGCTAGATSTTKPFTGTGKTSCDGASLALTDDAVVGQFNGKPVTYKDLGSELRTAEQKALRSYCDSVASTRSIAFDNHVTEALVGDAAKKAGVSNEEWVKAEVEKRVAEPSDVEIQAFYDKQKAAMGEQLPPLEVVKPQVVQFLKREGSEKAVEGVIGGLKKTASMTKSMPDVRSPPQDVANAKHTPSKGGKGAKVKIVEFADFQCPYCTKAAETAKELVAKYGDKVEVSYRHFPLRSIHPQAQRVSEIAQCAGEQDKFWQVHDALYANQAALDEPSAIATATAAGVDATKLTECLASGRAAAQVEEDFKKGESLGVQGTPSFFINGRQFDGNPTSAGMSATIDEALAL